MMHHMWSRLLLLLLIMLAMQWRCLQSVCLLSRRVSDLDILLLTAKLSVSCALTCFWREFCIGTITRMCEGVRGVGIVVSASGCAICHKHRCQGDPRICYSSYYLLLGRLRLRVQRNVLLLPDVTAGVIMIRLAFINLFLCFLPAAVVRTLTLGVVFGNKKQQ